MELHRTDEGFALYKEKTHGSVLRAHARRKGGCHHLVWHRPAVAAQGLRLLSIKEVLRSFGGYDREAATVFTTRCPPMPQSLRSGQIRLCSRGAAAGAPPHAGPDRRQVRAGLSGRPAGHSRAFASTPPAATAATRPSCAASPRRKGGCSAFDVQPKLPLPPPAPGWNRLGVPAARYEPALRKPRRPFTGCAARHGRCGDVQLWLAAGGRPRGVLHRAEQHPALQAALRRRCAPAAW